MEEVEVAGFFTGNCCLTGRLFLVLVLVAVVVVVVCSIGGGGGVFFILGGLGGATLTGVSTTAAAAGAGLVVDSWVIKPVSSPPAAGFSRQKFEFSGLAICCCGG